MTRRCSQCTIHGHNSRTCPTRGCSGGASLSGGVRLFGVRLTDGSIIKKSASMGNLSSMAAASHFQSSPSNNGSDSPPLHDGYLSDDPAHASSSSANPRGDRKKGVPWTEEEHRKFLIGLQKLGKGDWRGISRMYVVTRTPTQVASHAQKYFIRQSNSNRRKRRSSLFDMAPDMDVDPPYMPEEQALLPCQEERESEDPSELPSLNLSLGSECSKPLGKTQEDEPTIETENQSVMGFNGYHNGYPPAIPHFIPYVPYHFPVWPSTGPLIMENGGDASHYPQVLKPVPSLPKESGNVEAVVGMSQLNLGEAKSVQRNPSFLSLTSLGEPSRQSAFHPNSPASEPDLSEGKTSVIQAV